MFLQLGEQAAGLGWERLTPGADWWTKTVHERKAEHGRMHAPGRLARAAGRQAHLCSAGCGRHLVTGWRILSRFHFSPY